MPRDPLVHVFDTTVVASLVAMTQRPMPPARRALIEEMRRTCPPLVFAHVCQAWARIGGVPPPPPALTMGVLAPLDMAFNSAHQWPAFAHNASAIAMQWVEGTVAILRQRGRTPWDIRAMDMVYDATADAVIYVFEL